MNQSTARPSRDSLVALVWEHAPSKYSGSALVILHKLASLSGSAGYAYPSNFYLSKSCNVAVRQLQRITRQLRVDGVLKINRATGRNRYYLQPDALRQLPLACPPRENEANAPQHTAETAPAKSASTRLAKALEEAVRGEIPGAHIPEDWATVWPATLQPLFEQGHSIDTLKKVARHAIDHEWWRDELAKHGPSIIVQNIELMTSQIAAKEQGQ